VYTYLSGFSPDPTDLASILERSQECMALWVAMGLWRRNPRCMEPRKKISRDGGVILEPRCSSLTVAKSSTLSILENLHRLGGGGGRQKLRVEDTNMTRCFNTSSKVFRLFPAGS
jgi:hypothetical protein